MSDHRDPEWSRPLEQPRRGLPRWARVLLIVLAVLIIAAGVCTAIAVSNF